MALTAQLVANDAAREVRKYFYDTTTNAVATAAETLFIGWVNLVHQDVLHTSIWKSQLITSETFTSAPNGSPYILTANNIRHILNIHDVINRRNLIPYNDLNAPAATSLPPERSGQARPKFDQTQETSGLYPTCYIFEACVLATDGSVTQGLHLLPDPLDADHSGTIRYWYSKEIEAIDALTDVLLVPEDGRDIMVAGVAAKAWAYVRGPESAAAKAALDTYEGMKKGF